MACTGRPNRKVVWPERLAKGARADDVHCPWLEVHQHVEHSVLVVVVVVVVVVVWGCGVCVTALFGFCVLLLF